MAVGAVGARSAAMSSDGASGTIGGPVTVAAGGVNVAKALGSLSEYEYLTGDVSI